MSQHERCDCHDCTQYRARQGLGGLAGAAQNTMPPRCPKHGELTIIHFYDRPGSPPGNGWMCRSCAAEIMKAERA